MIGTSTINREVTVTFTEDEVRAIHGFTRGLPLIGSDRAVFHLFQTFARSLREWEPEPKAKRGWFRR